MKKSLEGKKDWLATVKMVQKLHNDRNMVEDEFDMNNALRAWIGIPKTII